MDLTDFNINLPRRLFERHSVAASEVIPKLDVLSENITDSRCSLEPPTKTNSVNRSDIRMSRKSSQPPLKGLKSPLTPAEHKQRNQFDFISQEELNNRIDSEHWDESAILSRNKSSMRGPNTTQKIMSTPVLSDRTKTKCFCDLKQVQDPCCTMCIH